MRDLWGLLCELATVVAVCVSGCVSLAVGLSWLWPASAEVASGFAAGVAAALVAGSVGALYQGR